MKKKIFSIFMLLLVVSMGAWATEKELSPVGVLSWTNTPAITYDGEATSWAINQGGISGGKLGKYAGPYAIVKFDASSILDGMTLLSATLDFDITAGAYNSSINIAQMSDATFTPSTVTVDDFDATATQFQSGDWSTKNTTIHFSYDVKARVEANNVLAFAIYTNTGREQTLKDVKLVLNYSDAPVAKYNYSLKAVTSEALDIKTLAEGEEFETNSATLYFPYMFYNESTLYTTATKPYSVTVDKDNANQTVTYAADGGDIVAYMEGEAAEANSGFDVAYSNGKTGHAAGNKTVTIATLPAGKYTATINFVANGNRSCVIRNTANTDVATNAIVSLPIDKNSSAGIYTSDEFTLTEETTIGFSGYTSDTKTNQSADIDYIFIEKTGEYVPVVTSYTVTISNEIENGTVVADPTSANAGAEVTLTNTPAEGYEFVSYSVTGVKSNEAVLVTDGKFTMPADDVTVSATFAKVYAVTISNEIEGGTVAADPTSAKAGDEVTLTNTPAEGYEFVSYSVTGKIIDEAVIVTDGKFTMPADDVTVSAEFQKKAAPATYSVTIADGIVGGTVVADPTSAKAGDEVTLTNTPAEGYEFVSYSVTGKIIDEAVIVTDGKFTMPADDVTVSAEFQKKAAPTIYIETDLTAKFNSLATTKWTGSSGQVGWAAPKVKTNSGLEVAAWERYNESCDWTGDIMSSSVTGLVPGTYKIELYGAAAFTFGRGFGSTAFTGDFSKDKSDTYKENESIDENTGVTLFAETAEGKVSKEIPIWYATNFNTSGIATATLENVIVGESGEIKIGLSKTSTSTNWHVVQLKGVTAQVPAADALADAVATAKAVEENSIPAKAYSALQTVITENDKVFNTAEEYKAAIAAINEATATANTFVAPYAEWKKVAPIATKVGVELPDISEMTAEELAAAVKNLYVEMYNYTTTKLADDSKLLGDWTDAPGTNKGESWDGTAEDTYYDAWNKDPFAMTQTIALPAGKYVLMVKARASAGAGIDMTDGTTTIDMPKNGSEGLGIQTDGTPSYSSNGVFANNNKGRGWEYRFLPFASDGTTETTLTINWDTRNGQWIGVDDIQLYGPQLFDINVVQPENGTVEVAPAMAAEGAVVTITATPAEGYKLASVSVTGVHEELAVTVTDGKFTMPADDVTVNATFAKVYAVKIALGMQNGTVEGPASAAAEEKVTLKVTPAEGYELETLTIKCEESQNEINYDVVDYSFTMPSEPVNIVATFKEKSVDPSGDEEVALAADMFYTWDGYGADASKIASATVDFKVGESVDQGATVVGTGSVDYLTYADMTGSTKVIFEGTNGTAIRLLMNRQESNTGPLVEKTATIAEGKAEISLTDLAYVHINAIKIPWNGSTGNIISAITFVKPNDPLAGPKEALKDAIAAAKMQNSVAKTEESFAALTKAITDGEAALADAEATVESLTTAKSNIETAVKGLTLAEGYAEVTKEMFKQYASVDEPGEGTATGGAYELFTASGLPYGDGSVSELKWADLTKYDKLIVTVAGNVAPRLCMNRLVKDGQQAATQEESKMLDINPNNGNTWSTEKYQTASDGVYTIDLAAIVKDYTFARLHCIKAQGGGSTVVTGMYLHEAPAPVVYAVTIAEGIEGGTVAADPTSAKEGDEVTLINTPAEGYEFVSYSVTGKSTDVAVIVTDGKFTMPADDVTVNATFQKKSVIYIETDLTAKFNSLATTKWTGSSGQVGWAAPKVKTNSGLEVAAWERYNESCDWTGDIMSSSVTGLAPGTYKIELYGAAAFTFGRGFGSTAFTGDFSKDTSDTYKENESIDENTGVTLYAETAEGKVSKEIPIWYATNFNTSGIATATLENVIVGESGEIKIGLSKTSTSTNWHVVQLKGVTAQVPAADVLADAVEAAKSIAESDVPAALYSEIQEAITTYDKEYSTADEYLTAINALNALVDKANGYAPLSAVLNEGAQYKANVPAESPAIAAYDAAIADVKSAYDAAVVADIPAAVKVVEAALPAIAKAQTAPNSDMTRVIVNPTIDGATGWTCEKPKGGNGPLLNGTAFEYWAGNASPRSEGSFDYYQVIEGLPSGKYIISAEMYNSLNGEEGAVFAPTSGVYASSGNDETATLVDVDGTEYIRYATEPVFVKDGTLRLGVKNTEIPMAARWFSADNFTLTLVETIPTYEVDLAEPQNGAIEVSAAVAAEGDKVVVIATPNEGYELESVSVKGVTSDIAVQVVTDEVTGEMSFTMPKDAVEVSATFKQIAYPITYAIGMQNGTVEGPVESVAGEKVTLTVTPAEGYELENLTITCAESQNEINYDVVDYSFTMPKEGVYIIATFVQTTGIDAASAAKGKKIGVKKYFKNGELIIIGKDGKEFRANGAAK